MSQPIDLSIIVPVYNVEAYIEKAIASILSQEPHTLRFEIIVVDDCSTDASLALVKKMMDNRIVLIELAQNKGLSNARNEGLKIAKGDWVLFFDSDDELGQDLFIKFERARSGNYNCYLFSRILEFPNYRLIQNIKSVKDLRAFTYFTSSCTKFIKRAICCDFRTGYLFEDIIFSVDMMNTSALEMKLIPNAYYIYNKKNTGSITAKFNSKAFIDTFNLIIKDLKKYNWQTKMFLLELYFGFLFHRFAPFRTSLYVASVIFLKLYYLMPFVVFNQMRKQVENIYQR
jgi:glycosyltransferase involved in cell wall biosynthesis